MLVARAAMWNPSIFNPAGPLEMEDVICQYIKIALKFDFCYELMKYNILNVMRGRQDADERGIKTRKALTAEHIAEAWGVEVPEDQPAKKRRRIDVFPYEKNHYKINRNWPKQSLEKFYKGNSSFVEKPSYENVRREADSRYQSTLRLW